MYLENLARPRYLLGPAMPDRLFPGRAAAFLLTHCTDTLDGRRVRFFERSPEVMAWHLDRPETRSVQLLLTPQDAAGQP
jgi:hypothetical protein